MRMLRGDWKPAGGFFDEHDVRDAAWRSAFSGACGHAYGCHSVWQAYDPAGPLATPPMNFPTGPWHTQLRLPGAEQMCHLAAFMREQEDWEPIPPAPGCDLPALRSGAARELAVYVPRGLPETYRRAQVDAFTRATGRSPVRGLCPRTGADVPLVGSRSADPGLDAVLRFA